MEAPTGVSLGAMESLLRKLDALLLAPGCRLPKRVKDAMHLLKDDLEEVSAYLEDLAEVEDPPLTAKCWMKSVRELSYDFEDYIDKFPRAAHGNVKATRFVCKIIRIKNLRIPKRLKWHQQMANMVSEFRMYVQEAIERYERYGLDCGTSRRRFVSVGPMLPAPYEETADLVIDGRMSEFVNSLANDGDQQLKVVSVLGPGCIGKTTLAGVLYNILGGQFDCRAFIRVSQKPDMKRLFRDVLWQVQRRQPPNDCKELDLIHNIRTHLQDKRYLIVFDDLWAASVWDIINHAFPEGTRRSRIITTTQIEDVALTCCCYRSDYVFEMKPLDNYHSRKLFFDKLFCSRSGCPQQFKEVSNEIVGICGGLPLATISIASLLASQPVILMDLLTYIRDSLRSYLWTNSTSEETRQVLHLSYNNLPHYLKTCLLYLSMYPEGSTICKDDLVKQWLAEGFIDTTEGRDMEKVAGSYFDELIYRRFIQPIGINYNDEVLSCTVHDVVHDLIAYKSAEENFIVVVDYYRKNVALSEKVRRLSLHFGDARYAKTPANIRTSQVRSLAFFGLFLCMPSLTEFKLLRVLNLQLYSHRGDDTVDLTGLSELFQLRYLKITCDVCIELPNHMRGLQYLETLHMDTKVSAVPWDIFHLPRLLHLRLPVETNLSDWIGSTRSVSLRCLGKLNDLQDLHLTCSKPASNLLERNMEALGSLLGGLGSLKTLALVTGSSDKNDMVRGGSEVTVPWDGLAPPLLLQRFEWLPHSCIFSRVPKWIEELGNLRILKISVKELLMNGVDILRGLPALTALSLYVQAAPVRMIVFDKVGFSVLKYFKFRCSVSWLKFEADAMPSLRTLKLGFNAAGVDQHGTAPISIEHLPGLKEISVKVGGAGADAESALRVAVSNHRSNPRIKVQLVDCPFFGDEIKSMGTDEKERTTLEQQYEILEEDPGKFYRTQAEDQEKHENTQADSRMPVPSGFSLHLPVADIPQILLEAQTRWLRPSEICRILLNYKNFSIAPQPPHRPPSGSLFLFDRKILRYFRKDGHNWRKKKDGKTIKEAHEKLKEAGVNVLHCYYAHGEENWNFQRRTYWLSEEDLMHIVLVHYLQCKGQNYSYTDGSTRYPLLNQSSGALTDPTPQFTSGISCADLEPENRHKGIARFLAEIALPSHSRGAFLKAAQDVIRVSQSLKVESFHRKKVVEYGDDDHVLSRERRLSLVSRKNDKPGQNDMLLLSAAVRIQNKFREWKGRKEFTITQQKIIKKQGVAHGLDLLKKGLIWRVCDGKKIRIWRDNWIPRDWGLKISGKATRSQLRWVNKLLLPNGREWDVEAVRRVLYPLDAEEVLKLKIPIHGEDDFLACHYEKNGVFSVRSAYKLALHERDLEQDNGASSHHPDGHRSMWSLIWKSGVPQKVKIFAWKLACNGLATGLNCLRRQISLSGRCLICGNSEEDGFHAVVQCTKARALRSELRTWWDLPSEECFVFSGPDWFLNLLDQGDERQRVFILMLFWRAWYLRNDVLHARGAATVGASASFLMSYVNSLLQIKSWEVDPKGKAALVPVAINPATRLATSCWEAPPEGWLKLNTDAGFWEASGSASAGIIVRNCGGEAILAAALKLPVCSSAEEAELLAGMKGVRLILEYTTLPVMFESDCLSLVKGLKEPGRDLSALGLMVYELKTALNLLPDFSVKHVKRECNLVAHELARWASRDPNLPLWVLEDPPGLSELLFKDCTPFCYE